MSYQSIKAQKEATFNKEQLADNSIRNDLDASKISEKIQMMRQSIAQLSVLSRGKNIQNIRRLENQHESAANYVEQEQRKIIFELNTLDQTIIKMERARMLHNVSLANSCQSIEQTIKNAEDEFRTVNKLNHQKFEEYRDQIMNLKIQLAELEVISKDRIGKFDRDCRSKLINCTRSMQLYAQECGRPKFQKQFKELKNLKAAIQQQQKIQLKDLSKISCQVGQLKQLISSKIAQQQRRQKDGFSQNYNALQQLFLFLSEQYGVQS